MPLDRRSVLAGAVATVAVAAIPAIGTCEGAVPQWVDTACPDDFGQWPEIYQKVAKAALHRFMEINPDAQVVSERSRCVDLRVEPGFAYPWVSPDGKQRCDFVLYWVVIFDRPVQGHKENAA